MAIQTKPAPAAPAPSGSASTPPRRVRAVVFSNFPGQYFHEKMLPKFAEHNVEVLRTIHMDRSSSQDCSGADIVVAMVDLMAHGQRTQVKEIAKKWGLRFVGLSKRSPWKDYLNIPVAPDRDERKVIPLHNRNVVKEYKPEELLTLEGPPPSEAPEPSSEELQELIEIYEMENRDLLEFKKVFGETLKAREDNILDLMLKADEQKKASDLLEKRLKDQIEIRAEVERDLHAAKEALDAMALQLEALKRAPPPAATTEAPASPGTLSATKAHNTRLRNENEVLTKAHKDELERTRVARNALHEEQVAHGVTRQKLEEATRLLKERVETNKTEASVDRDDLIAWGNAVRDTVTPNPVAYRKLLELGAKYNVDIATILEQVG